MVLANSINANAAGMLENNGTTGITQQSTVQYALLVGDASTYGFNSLPTGTSNQLLQSGGAAADPSWTAYPQLSGLGIGASPGSNAGLTFDGTNFLDAYLAPNTYLPTAYGSSVAGTQTYTTQGGRYMQIGEIMYVTFEVQGTFGATASGSIRVSLPVTAAVTSRNQYAPGYCVNVTFYTGSWQCSSGNNYIIFLQSGTGTAAPVNASNLFNFQGSLWYYV